MRIRTHRYRFYEVSIGTTTAVIDVLSESWNVKVMVGPRLRPCRPSRADSV